MLVEGRSMADPLAPFNGRLQHVCARVTMFCIIKLVFSERESENVRQKTPVYK